MRDEFIVNWFTIPPLDKQSLVEARDTQEKRHNQERDRWQYEMDKLRKANKNLRDALNQRDVANGQLEHDLRDAQAACKKMREANAVKDLAYAEAAMLINRAEDALKRAHSA